MPSSEEGGGFTQRRRGGREAEEWKSSEYGRTFPIFAQFRKLFASFRGLPLSKTAMAERMKTSRAALNRLLDPANNSVTLATLQKAAAAVGREIRLELV